MVDDERWVRRMRREKVYSMVSNGGDFVVSMVGDGEVIGGDVLFMLSVEEFVVVVVVVGVELISMGGGNMVNGNGSV